MSCDGWPFEYDGLVESVTTTRQSDGSWNVAALGIRPGDANRTARTWGRTRTRTNLERRSTCFVQCVSDSMAFSRAALGRWTRQDPILPVSHAWVQAEASRLESGSTAGTEWVDWSLVPIDSSVQDRRVPILGRGPAAVIEMTIAASRLGVADYDRDVLCDRIEYFASVARECGGQQEWDAVDWILDRIDVTIEDSAGEPARLHGGGSP